MLRYDQLYLLILLCSTNNAHTLLIFFNVPHTHKEATGLYGRSFPFFKHLVPVFTKDKAYTNARGDIGDDVAQYEHDVDITLEEDA